jgi:hypothetical protein
VRCAPPAVASRTLPRELRRRGGEARRTALRAPVRPLDDDTTESVRVIEFVWRAGDAFQPVLMLERQLLD